MKKGFTLIELLATIVILSAISLITIPIIMNLMDDYKEQAFRKSVESVFHTYLISDAEKGFLEERVLVSSLKMKNNNFIGGEVYQASDGAVVVERVNDGFYCAGGTKKDLTVVKGSCNKLDVTAPENVEILTNLVTSSSIAILVNATDLESDIVGYKYKIGDSAWTTIENTNTYTFSGLSRNSTYIVKVKAINGNDLETEQTKEITTTNIVMPTYSVDNISPTQNNVTVTITYPSNKETAWSYQYKKNNDSWETLTTGNTKEVTFTENGTLIARVVDTNNSNNAVDGSVFSIANIDKTVPNINFVTNGSTTLSKTKSTVVNVSDDQNDVDQENLKYLWTTRSTGIVETSFIGNTSGIFVNGSSITSPNNVSGNYYLWILAKDGVGNTKIVKSNLFNIDASLPVSFVTASTNDSTSQSVVLTIQSYDPVTFYDNGQMVVTSRDTYGNVFPEANYIGEKFRASAKVKKILAPDDSKTTTLGIYFRYKNTEEVLTSNWSAVASPNKFQDIESQTNISGVYTVPTTYDTALRPWIQINIGHTVTGYKAEYNDVLYEHYDKTKINRIRKPDGTWISGNTTTYEVIENGNYSFVVEDMAGNQNTVTYVVSNIDTAGPNITNFISNEITSSSVTVLVTTSDLNGIKGYYYSSDNGTNWTSMMTTNTHIFEGLNKETIYNFKVKVEDNLGNFTISEPLLATTTTIATPQYEVTTNEITNDDVTVTITYPSNKETAWSYQYKKNNDSWETLTTGNIKEVTFSENGTLVARVIDTNNSNNTIEASVFSVANIDKTDPELIIPGNSTITTDDTSYDLDNGVSCTDDSGTCNIDRSGTIVFGTIGTYTITYTATDMAGNDISKQRIITVENYTPQLLTPIMTTWDNGTVKILAPKQYSSEPNYYDYDGIGNPSYAITNTDPTGGGYQMASHQIGPGYYEGTTADNWIGYEFANKINLDSVCICISLWSDRSKPSTFSGTMYISYNGTDFVSVAPVQTTINWGSINTEGTVVVNSNDPNKTGFKYTKTIDLSSYKNVKSIKFVQSTITYTSWPSTTYLSVKSLQVYGKNA